MSKLQQGIREVSHVPRKQKGSLPTLQDNNELESNRGVKLVNGEIYDCGCVVNRPKEASCKTYGTRWRVYISSKHLILKCRDCGKQRRFKLAHPGIDAIIYGEKEEYGVDDE